jgi:hypothetical protein
MHVAHGLEVSSQTNNRHILTIAFSPIQARACDKVMLLGKEGMTKITGAGETHTAEDGYLRSFARAIAPGASAGQGLDALNREAVNHFAASFDRLAAHGSNTVNLFEWLRHEIFASTMEATYGPHNPFRHPQNEKAWLELESGIMMLLMDIFPNIFARKSLKACHVLVAEFNRYFQDNKHLDGSLIVQLREKHNAAFGLNTKDTAHIEIGQVAACIVNIAPTAFWLVWQVLADPIILEDCTREVTQLVTTNAEGISTIDLSHIIRPVLFLYQLGRKSYVFMAQA